MNDMPLISVVIPMYNVKDYIRETLKSVLEQTYRNIEIIVIDDGSTDGSSEIVKKLQYEHKNIYYVYQSNRGVSAARNLGIKLANGEYIAFLDSDDLWKKEKLNKQIKGIIKLGADASYCGTIDYFEDKKIYIKEKIRFYNGHVLIHFLKDDFWGQTGTWIVRKKLILDNDIFFNEDCNWGEDFEFFFKIMALGNVISIDEFLFIYRRRKNSLSEFSYSKFQEIDVWNRLKIWINNREKLNYKKEDIINIIDNFRLPSAAIKIVFESLKCNDSLNNIVLQPYEEKYELSKYINSLKYFVGNSTMTLKVSIYKYMIKYKMLYKIFKSLRK